MTCKYCKYFNTCGDSSRNQPCNGKELSLAFFMEITEYGNVNWAKGSFTTEEVKENAEIYHADYLYSKSLETIAESIKTLCKNLAEDAREMPDLTEVKEWLREIANELSLVDMDYADYLDTDGWLGGV